jgi:hypothetical protein
MFAGGSIVGTASCVVGAASSDGIVADAKRTVDVPELFCAAAGQADAIVSPTAAKRWRDKRNRRIGGLHAKGNARKAVTTGDAASVAGVDHAAFLIVKVSRATCGQLDE